MNETLEHHGILGMKWGVRRYQNKDGTWTEEGKDHRQSDGNIEANNARYSKYSAHSNDPQYRDKADPVLYNNVTTNHPEEVKQYAEVNKEYYDYVKEKTPEIIVDYVNSIYGGKATAENFDDELQNDWDHSDVEAYLGSNTNDSHYKELKEKWLSSLRQMYKLISDETDKYLGDNSDVKEYDMSSKIEDQILKDRNGKTEREMAVEINDLINETMYNEYKRLSGEDKEAHHSDDSTEDSLMHYGIKGQSWGKRNFQYEDGTLTAEGKKRYASDSGGVRGRRRTTNTVQGEDVHKTESVNQGKAPQLTQQVMQSTTAQAHDLPTDKKNNKMSDEDYAKAKQEFAKRDFVQVYDGAAGKMLYVKKDEFRDHIRRLADQGIEVKMPYLDSSDTSEESMADIRAKNAEVRYWNELVEKAQSQTYAGPESEGLHTREDQKAAREAMAERREKARIEAEQKKARLEDNRKRTTSVAQSDSSEDILEHHGILGMKWGIRRYQNSDGSLTAAGRKRYGVDENDGQRSSSGQSSGDSSNTITRTPAKSASEMTDQELNQALNRLRMEQQYNELTGAKSSNQYQNQQNFSTPPSNTGNLSNAELQAYITRLDMEKRYAQLTAPPPKEVSAGKKFMNDVVGPAINQVAKAFIVASLSKALGLKGDGDNGGNNNNNGGKNNNDSQYKSLKKELNDLKSMMGSQRKQQDSGGNQKKESKREETPEVTNLLPEPGKTSYKEHRNSIIDAARAAADAAREKKRQRDALSDRLSDYRSDRERARQREEERRRAAQNPYSSDYYRSMWTYGM